MNNGFRALFLNELTKLKRSLVLFMVVAAPAGVVTLVALLLVSGAADPDDVGWPRFLASGTAIWCYLVLPMVIAIQAAGLCQLEHESNGWRRWFSSPVSIHLTFLAKLVLLLLLLLLSSMLLAVLLTTIPVVSHVVGGSGPVPKLQDALQLFFSLCRAWLGAWLIAVVHLGLSWRFRSFVLPIGIGLVAIIGIMQAGSSEYWIWHPWTWPMTAALGSAVEQRVAISASLAGGGIAALAMAAASRRLQSAC